MLCGGRDRRWVLSGQNILEGRLDKQRAGLGSANIGTVFELVKPQEALVMKLVKDVWLESLENKF